METIQIHQCICKGCQSKQGHQEQALHHQLNVVIGRLDEQQRRWYAAVEANRRGRGGIQQVSEITGLDAKTIRRGQEELALELSERPKERIRLRGAGRPSLEKKARSQG